MGKNDSSKTRVEPFFKQLYARDSTGASWLSKLLSIAPNRHSLFAEAMHKPGLMHQIQFGKEELLDPPREYLQWLIENPQTMTWNDSKGVKTQRWREKLMSRRDLSNEHPQRHSEIRQSECAWAIQYGLQQLSTFGVPGSIGKAWAFEGCTHVDCYIATDQLNLYIEGKRNDKFSTRTRWSPKRNQIMRNLESAQTHSKGAPFGCLLIVETKTNQPSKAEIREGLPHMSSEQRQELMSHLLGQITWREACEATGLRYKEVFAGHID